MNTIKKFISWVITALASFVSMFTTSAFVNNPRLIIEQLKRSKSSKLQQIEEALTTTLTQVKQWKKDCEALERKRDAVNVEIAKAVAAGETERAGKLAKTHERHVADIERIKKNIDSFEQTYKKLLKAREDICFAFDSKIAEAESSIASVAVNRQMIELCRLTKQCLAADSNTELGIAADLVKSLEEEQIRLESELQVRDDVSGEGTTSSAVLEDADGAEALARWTAANASR